MDLSTPSILSRQHGAMEFSEPPTDLDAVRRYRIERVRAELAKSDVAGALLYDQLNTRYATDATNMQIWCLHNETRYVFVPTEGPVILFEYGSCRHLAEDLPNIDEVRPCVPWFYFAAGDRHEQRAAKWCAEIVDLVHRYGGGNRRLAIDRIAPLGVQLLEKAGVQVVEAFPIMERAREIKSPGEIKLMRHAIEVCELGMTAMRNALAPGVTENAVWAKLHETNIALGGEWIETRLLSSGPRTNPWFREASMRKIQAGEMVSFDTDLIGPYGYCADLSRSWLCGDGKPNDEQRRIYALACEQIEHNRSLLRPGVGLRELSEQCWTMPDEFWGNRYGSLFHGVGLCDEAPAIKHFREFDERGYDGVLEAGMTLCVESYIGSEGGHEGVKLEEQVLITEDGYEQLSSYPLELDWL